MERKVDIYSLNRDSNLDDFLVLKINLARRLIDTVDLTFSFVKSANRLTENFEDRKKILLH